MKRIFWKNVWITIRQVTGDLSYRPVFQRSLFQIFLILIERIVFHEHSSIILQWHQWRSWFFHPGAFTSRLYVLFEDTNRKKYPKLCYNNSWLLHPITQQFFHLCLLEIFDCPKKIQQSRLSHHIHRILSLRHFRFRKLKRPMKIRKFAMIEKIKTASL